MDDEVQARPRGRPWRRWLRQGLRVGGAASIVGALLGLLGLRSALAGVEEATSSGLSMLEAQLGDGLVEPQELWLNGQRLFVSSAVTDLSSDAVLDRFSKECADSDASPAARPELRLLRRALVQRAQDEREGHLACLALRRELSTPAQLVDAVRRFAHSHDLAALGAARVVRVRARPDGGSHVLTFWTEGAFRPFELLSPPDEDVLVADAWGVAPPTGARHDLNLSAPGHPYGLQAYRVPLPLEEALQYYERALPAVGFTALDRAAAGLEWKEPGRDARVFWRGDAAAYVIALAAGTGTRLLVMQSAVSAAEATSGPPEQSSPLPERAIAKAPSQRAE